jgi:hypothetical protein
MMFLCSDTIDMNGVKLLEFSLDLRKPNLPFDPGPKHRPENT